MPKLHANGLTALHVDEKEIKAKDGMIDVPAEHVDEALSHGCTHEPKKTVAPAPDLTARVAALEARLDALEAAGKKAG